MQSSAPGINKKSRPVGVIVIALFYCVISLIVLCFILPAISAVPAPASGEAAGRIANQVFLLWSEALSGLIAGIGLLFLAEWARWLAIARAGFGIVAVLWITSSETVTGSILLQVLVAVGIIVYLVQPGVRKAFAA